MSVRAASWLSLPCLCLCLACGADDGGATTMADASESGDGDGDPASGDGDGDSGDGDGDGDSGPGDGDGDTGPGDGDGDPGPACSGHVELCERPFDEVVFATTHNSHAALDDGFTAFNANHQQGISAQLDAGVRGMLIDTYYEDGPGSPIILCHGPCGLGSISHLDTLQVFVEFLEANPGELLTLIYQDGVSPQDLAVEYETSGAIELVYAHPEGTPWPTLGELVEANTRLIVTAENSGPPPDWHHNIWEIGWDTPYGPSDPADLSCELNRGSTDNDLFLVNHWVNTEINLPSAANADVVNAYDFLLARAQECAQLWDHAPNFLAVDFWERGDLFAVVDTLNGVN